MAGHQVPLQGVEPAVPGANGTEVRKAGVQGSAGPHVQAALPPLPLSELPPPLAPAPLVRRSRSCLPD